MGSLPCRQGEAHPSPPADDKTATSPFAAQVWRGGPSGAAGRRRTSWPRCASWSTAWHLADLAYAVGDVFCDSKACVYTVGLRPGARAPWRYLEAEVQAWVDAGWRVASIQGPQFESDWLQFGGDPEDEDSPRRHRLAEDARVLLGEPTAVRVRMARRLVEELEAALEAA